MRKLSICFVSREYPPETGYGGIGTYHWEMANALAKAGHEAIVIAKAVNGASYQVINGVHVYRIRPRFDLSRHRFFWRFSHYWEGYRLTVALTLKEINRRHHIDVIETPEILAEPFIYRALPGRHKPIIVRLHSGTAMALRYNNAPRIPRFRINTALEKWLVNHADYVTSPSIALFNASHPLFDLNPTHCKVIPNPIDTTLFQPAPVEQAEKRRVLFVGRLEWWKGPDLLIDVVPTIAEQFNDAEFYFVGADSITDIGSPFSEILLARIPDRYAAHIHFKPAVRRNELASLYQSAATVVVPSRWEGFGYVCAEAMACGRATIASRIGGLQEIVQEDVSGILFDPSNPSDLVQALTMVLSNPDLRRKLGQEARHRIEDHFSLHQVFKHMVSLYEQVLQS